MPAIDAKTRTRLINLLGMTGSAGDGEALNAIRMATKLLKDLKLTWADVIGTGAPAPRTAYPIREPDDFKPAGRSPMQHAHDSLDPEKMAVATARLRLDKILAGKMSAQKRAHFEAILSRHKFHGYISAEHRAQIDRAFFTSGWDEPVAGQRADFVGTDGLDKLADELRKALSESQLERTAAAAGTRECGLRCGYSEKIGQTDHSLLGQFVCPACWGKFATPEERRAYEG